MKKVKIIIFLTISLCVIFSGCNNGIRIGSLSLQEKELLKKQIEVANMENSALNNTAEVFQKNYDNLPSGYSQYTSQAAGNLYDFFSDIKYHYNNTNLYTLIPCQETKNYINAMISTGKDGMEAMSQLIDYCNTKSMRHFNGFSDKIIDSEYDLKLARQELNRIMDTLRTGKPIGANGILN